MKKKKEFNLEQEKTKTVIATLRKASLYWKPINECRKLSKVAPKQYRCSLCSSIVDKVHIDHINPIMPLDALKIDYNVFVNNLFCDIDNLQALCNECLDKKTKEENAIRRANKKL